jgi:ABC-type transport system substrate-binding protein
MQKARRLARESGTTNVPVTVWSFDGSQDKAAGSYLVRLLTDLGFRARLHPVPFSEYFDKAYDSRSKIQMGIGGGWGLDYPAPSSFYRPLLSCRSFYQDPANTPNWAGFCDPHLDNLASQAQAAQLTDPAAARRRWVQVDRIATDQAPYVPVYNDAGAGFVSSRVANYQASPLYGPLLDQMWVR